MHDNLLFFIILHSLLRVFVAGKVTLNTIQ